jgi:hypothetical protein
MEAKSKTDLVAFLKEGARQVQLGFDNPEDDWLPVMAVQSPAGVGLIMVHISDDKDATAERLTRMLRSQGVTEAVLLASSWTVERDQPALDGPVSEQPDRKEVLVLTQVTTDSADMFMAEIIRHEDSPPTLGEWENRAGGIGITGIFADALRKGIG